MTKYITEEEKTVWKIIDLLPISLLATNKYFFSVAQNSRLN
jgi:hypothetical protein